jgi:hypothetical protein
MSRVSGHFCFEALPCFPEQGGKAKMKVSVANGHLFVLAAPPQGSAQLILPGPLS